MKNILSILLLSLWSLSSASIPPTENEIIRRGLPQMESGWGDSIKVVFETGRKSIFGFDEMKFSLQHPASFYPIRSEEVPWLTPETFTDQNGTFITYQQKGAEKVLSEPYIMVQYISRDMENCESTEAIYAWLDNLFLVEKGRGRVLKEFFSRETASGIKADCKEYFSPSITTRLPSKRIAYAYFEYDEKYIIGMNITTYNDKDFKKLKKTFYKIVKSFKKIP